MEFTLHHCKYSTKCTQSRFIIVQPSLNFAITLCKLSNERKLGKQALSIFNSILSGITKGCKSFDFLLQALINANVVLDMQNQQSIILVLTL